jgi:hypothetical protein
MAETKNKNAKLKKPYAILFSCKRLLEVLTGALGTAGIWPFVPQNSTEDMLFERLVLALMVLPSVQSCESTGQFTLRCKSPYPPSTRKSFHRECLAGVVQPNIRQVKITYALCWAECFSHRSSCSTTHHWPSRNPVERYLRRRSSVMPLIEKVSHRPRLR